MFENSVNLFKRDAGEPLDELRNLRTVFEVFE